jgi:AraC-like DNA-binding protein/mannose-6-phosphate isomerase-like protein (cupin superfamily)
MATTERALRVTSHPHGPVHRAVYGTSRALGEVEFLTARFGTHRFAPHIHPVYAVGCVESGGCRIWHRGQSYVARPGDLILINPGDPHSAEPATAEPWDYSAVYFSSALLAQWIGGRATRARGLRLQGVVGHDPALARALTALCRTLEHDPEATAGEASFARLVAALFQRFGRVAEVPTEEANIDATDRVRGYLEEHFARRIRIEELAGLVGQSPFRVIRDFTRRFGMPPYTFLQHVRIARARVMLKAGFPITETALSVGFNDQSHLTKFFRRIIGVPPGLFARGLADGSSARG